MPGNFPSDLNGVPLPGRTVFVNLGSRQAWNAATTVCLDSGS